MRRKSGEWKEGVRILQAAAQHSKEERAGDVWGGDRKRPGLLAMLRGVCTFCCVAFKITGLSGGEMGSCMSVLLPTERDPDQHPMRQAAHFLLEVGAAI